MSEDQGVVSNSQWLCQTFENLSNHIPLGDNDIIELDISDPGDLGLFIFPEEYVGQRKLSLALTSAIPTATFLVQPLMSFIEYIPAKRFGIRIKSSQRMSVFAQIDISEDKVYEISRWIIGNEKASKLSKCVSIFGKACGCALEINKQGTPRLRFYGMIASRQQLDDYFQVAVAKDLINPNIKKRSAALWNSFAVEDLSVVLNIASSGSMLAKNSQNKEDDISLKLEFPNVSYMKVLQHLADYSQKIIFQRALSHLLASQGSIFPYIGVRLNRDNDTYTYYIDVNRVLRGRIST